jgi:hypothetical protein
MHVVTTSVPLTGATAADAAARAGTHSLYTAHMCIAYAMLTTSFLCTQARLHSLIQIILLLLDTLMPLLQACSGCQLAAART